MLYCCATTAGLPSDTLKPSRRFQLATFPRPVRSSHDLWKSKFYFYDWSETNLFCWMVPRLLTGTQSSIENSFQWSTFIGGSPGSSQVKPFPALHRLRVIFVGTRLEVSGDLHYTGRSPWVMATSWHQNNLMPWSFDIQCSPREKFNLKWKTCHAFYIRQHFHDV